MTNDEAIYVLKNTAWLGAEEQAEKVSEAVRMAIETLKRETSGDAIDRQEAIRIASGYCHFTNVAKELAKLPSVQPEPQWIPVTERLPEPRTDVWVNSDIGQIQGYYEESVETWYASFGQGRDYLELIVNAWMPLPEPYAERRTDGSD